MRPIRYNARLTGAFYFQAPPSFVRSSRSDEPAELIVILSGHYRASTRGLESIETIQARAGDIVFWPSGAERMEENPGGNPTRCITLYFQWQPAPPTRHCILDRGQLILHMAERIVELHQEQRHDTVATQNALLNGLLAHFVEAAILRDPPLVMQVTNYIDEHPTQRTRLSDLADHIHLEPHHLCRRYKQLTGRTIMDDVRRRKVEHARHILLSESGKTLAELADRAGIGDEHQLSRLLSKYTGMSAREWKRLARSEKKR